MNENVKKLMEALADPFPPEQIGFLPVGKPHGNRHLVVAYIDARDVQERLDRVVGPFGWQAEYVWREQGVVECRLSLRDPDGQWVTKVDVGCESDQPGAGDKAKAACSDALKRAAVQWGIGRYLYRLDEMWVDFDPEKKRAKGKPTLPEWALPRPQVKPAKEEPIDLVALEAGVAILALAVVEGVEGFRKAAETLSPAMKRAIGKARYDAYLMLAEAFDGARKPHPVTNGKHKLAAAAAS